MSASAGSSPRAGSSDSGDSSDRAQCGLCSSPEVPDLYSIKGLHLKKCGACGAVFVYPQPTYEELLPDYQEKYFLSGEHLDWGYADYMQLEGDIRETSKRRLKVMEKYLKGGRLLEAGCATGWFLDEARKQGYQVRGVEISDFAARWGRENLGLDIHIGPLAEAGYADGEFDAVVLWDVLEHLSDPLAELREINRVLKKGGYLFVSVPDAGSIWARLMGRRWFGYSKIREHIYYYDRRSLAGAMGRAGFSVVETRSSPFLVNLGFLVSKISQYSGFLARLLEKSLVRLGWRDKRLNLPRIDLMAAARKNSEV